jgi:hypothetical protein
LFAGSSDLLDKGWGLFEEPSHSDPGAFENARQDQLVFEPQSLRRVVAAEDVGRLRLGIEDDDNQNIRINIFRDFFENIRPPVARRADLDDEFRDFGTITRGQRASGKPGIAVIGDVGPSDGMLITRPRSCSRTKPASIKPAFKQTYPYLRSETGRPTILPCTSSSGWPGSCCSPNSFAVIRASAVAIGSAPALRIDQDQ